MARATKNYPTEYFKTPEDLASMGLKFYQSTRSIANYTNPEMGIFQVAEVAAWVSDFIENGWNVQVDHLRASVSGEGQALGEYYSYVFIKRD